jgi:hypothetical protein
VACDRLTYSAVDASRWARIKDVVSRNYGVDIESDRGEASKGGFALSWTYEPSDQTLEIQCVTKPFLVPCGVVNKRINDAAESAGITVA